MTAWLAGLGADATRLAGHAAFALAALAAVAAARGSRRAGRPDARLWWTIALVFGLLWLELSLDWRFVPRAVAQAALDARGAYGGRGGLQVALLGALAALAGVGAAATLWTVRRRRRAGARALPAFRPTTRIAFATTAALLALFAVEAVSLHGVDALLYRRLGPLLAVGWLWVGASAVVVGMAAAHSRGR